MNHKFHITIALLLIGCWCSATATLNSLFSTHAVLQQQVPIPVWGTAADGERVTVLFAGQVQETVAASGKWMVTLKPVKGSLTPYQLRVRAGNELVVDDILVGEVWLCSGQSNLAFPLRAVKPLQGYSTAANAIREAQNYPAIRQYTIPLIKHAATPAATADAKGKWLRCDSMNAGNFSAVAYFFARQLHTTLGMPVGIINSSYGGTAIENWMSRETLDQDPSWKSIFTNFDKEMASFPQRLESYKKQETVLLEAYSRDSLLACRNGTELPRKPSPPMSPVERGGPTGLWNTMILPLVPYAIKGCVWYQGEANASRGRQYRSLLPAFMRSWRTAWGQGDFPFVIIQIPGWKNHYPELREAQLLATQKEPNAALVVITDCDDTLDVHPGNKEPVGIRASLPALALAYGKKKMEYAGPQYQSMQVKGSEARIRFAHAGKGLVAKGGTLQDFEIAGADGKFVPAKAVINGKDEVVVSAAGVPIPVAVRMGWRLSPQVNLYNSEGLCAAAFRTNVD